MDGLWNLHNDEEINYWRANRVVSVDNGSRADSLSRAYVWRLGCSELTLCELTSLFMSSTNWFSHETILSRAAVDIHTRFCVRCVALSLALAHFYELRPLCICWGRLRGYNECRHWKLQLSLVPTFIEIASKKNIRSSRVILLCWSTEKAKCTLAELLLPVERHKSATEKLNQILCGSTHNVLTLKTSFALI